jgi:hypothetical protein
MERISHPDLPKGIKLSLKRDVLASLPLMPTEWISLDSSYQTQQASSALRGFLGLTPSSSEFGTPLSVENTTDEILEALEIDGERFRNELQVSITTAGNAEGLKTSRGLLYTRAALNGSGGSSDMSHFIREGGAIMTIRRKHLPKKTLSEINALADKLNTTSDWVVWAFDSQKSQIPETREDSIQLKQREAQIMKTISDAIIFFTLPLNENQVEEAKKLSDALNVAVNPLETLYIQQLLHQEIIREEITATRNALLPLAAMEVIILGAECFNKGAVAKIALLAGSDFVMSLTDAFLQKERFNQPVSQALIARWYEFLGLPVISTMFALGMEQFAKRGDYVDMAAAYAASMILSTAISIAVTGLTGSRKALPAEIARIPDVKKRLWATVKYYLPLPTREEIKNTPDTVKHFLQNPVTRGPIEGTVGASALMIGAAAAGTLRSTGGRAVVEGIAGAAEVVGLVARMATMKAHDWVTYCRMANKMIDSKK